MDVLIRDATEADMAAVLAIYNASIPTRQATTDLEPITLDQRLMSFRQHDPERRPFWVAELDRQVVGYCSVRDFYGRPAYYPTAEIAVYVAADHQGRGVGSQLLRHAIEQMPRLNLRTLLAFVFTHNAASIRLFERHDFERWGLLPNVADLKGQWVDVAILGYQRQV